MGFSNEHKTKMNEIRQYFKSVGLPMDKYSFVNYGDNILWVCTYIDWDHYFTQDMKDKMVEIGVSYDPRPRVYNNN
jgi:hypothetical protein